MKLNPLVLACALVSLTAPVAAQDNQKSVLVIHIVRRDGPAPELAERVIRTTLSDGVGEHLDYYSEFIDTGRFGGQEYEAALVDFLRRKYARRRFDLVVTSSRDSLAFGTRHRDELFPGVPIVFYTSAQQTWPPLTTGVVKPFDLTATLKSAIQLHPDLQRVVVVTGASAYDHSYEEPARAQFRAFEDRLQFTYLTGLPMPELLRQVSALPPDTVIYHLHVSEDGDGARFQPYDVLDQLAARANRPIYHFSALGLGRGIVGGRMLDLEAVWKATADLALRLLKGESPDSIPVREIDGTTLSYDWRELRRWGISEARLPAGSIVRFRPPTLWQSHKDYVIGGLSLIIAQAAAIAVLVQIARRRRAEAAVLEDEKRMALAVDAANLGMWVWDTPSDHFWVNERGKQIFGYAPEASVNQDMILARIHPEDRAVRSKAIERAFAGMGRYESEYRVLLPDGTVRWIACSGRVDRAAKVNTLHMIGVSIDITARKQAEAQALQHRAELAHVARVSTMGELAASVAHELNQPLGAILANTEAADLFLNQDPPALEEVRAILTDIRKDDERAGEVIRRMRALLRKQELDRQPLGINSVVEDVMRVVSADAALRNIALQADLAPVLPKILGDRVHLQQVLLNIILNGMDAMADQPRERRRLTLRTRLEATDGVELTVMDLGHGIDPEKLPRLFEPFFTTKSNGMGMGLSISRTIIEAHRGQISAENNASGGAVFRVRLPVSEGKK